MMEKDPIFTISGQGGPFLSLVLFRRPGLQVHLWKQVHPYPGKLFFEIHRPYVELELHLMGKSRFLIESQDKNTFLTNSLPGFWSFNSFEKCQGEIEPQPCEKGITLSIVLEPKELMRGSAYMAGLLLPVLQKASHASPQNPSLQSGPMNEAMFSIAGQMLDCPYTGIARELFLDAKAVELIALQVCLLTQKERINQESKFENKFLDAVRRAREFLLANLNQPPRLEDLARRVGLNRNSLTQGFRELYGLTVFEMLRTERLKRAMAFLKSSGMSLAEIAQASGYCAQSHFTSAFRAEFGISPGQFRKQSQANQGAEEFLDRFN